MTAFRRHDNRVTWEAMSGKQDEQDEARLRAAIEAYHASALAYAAVKLGLPGKMGTRRWTVEQLATELGLSRHPLLRFLRGLATICICEERADGTFALTSLGRSLAVAARREGRVRGREILPSLE